MYKNDVKESLRILKIEEEKFFRGKVKKLIFGVLLGAILLMAFWMSKGKEVETKIERPTSQYATENQKIYIEGYEDVIEVEVGAKTYTQSELEALYKEVLPTLEEEVLNKNTGFEEIKSNLKFPKNIDGTPFFLRYNPEDLELLTREGVVNNQNILEDKITNLEICVYCEDFERFYQIPLVIKALRSSYTEIEKFTQYLQKDEIEKREYEDWEFPEVYEKQVIKYKNKPTNEMPVFIGIFLAVILILWFVEDQKITTEREKRKEFFKEEYLEITRSLCLYITSGLTITKSIEKLIEEYRNNNASKYVKDAFFELEKEIKSGVSFYKTLDRFAENSDFRGYYNLIGILRQGDRNDMFSVGALLEQEINTLQEETIREIKIKGEKISTKLIFPMAIQLVVVIILIIVPALMGMNVS